LERAIVAPGTLRALAITVSPAAPAQLLGADAAVRKATHQVQAISKGNPQSR